MQTIRPKWPIALAIGLLFCAVVSILLLAHPLLVEPRESSPPPTVSSTDFETLCSRLSEAVENDAESGLELIERLNDPVSLETSPEDLPVEAAGLGAACEDERRIAILALAAPPPDKSLADEITAYWESIVKNWVSPFLAPATAALAISLALLIGARFATLAPGIRNGMRRPPKTRGAVWVLFVVLGSFGSVTAAVMLQESNWVSKFKKSDLAADLLRVGWIKDLSGGDFGKFVREPDWTVIIPFIQFAALLVSAALAVLGAVLLSRHLASRVRLSIEVFDAQGKPDAGATARVRNLLRQIGATPPKDLDAPIGTDLSAINEADIPSTVGGKPWELIVSIAKFVSGGTPWNFRIDTDGITYSNVNVRRNGRQLGMTTIPFGPESKSTLPADRRIEVYSASLVIVKLAKEYDAGFEGLTGVTNFGSLGLAFLALNDVRDDDERKRLLEMAVQEDSKNVLAEFNRQSSLYRRSIKPAELLDFMTWLAGAADAKDVPGTIEMLTRRSLAAAWINFLAIVVPVGELSETERLELKMVRRALVAGRLKSVRDDQLKFEARLLDLTTEAVGELTKEDFESLHRELASASELLTAIDEEKVDTSFPALTGLQITQSRDGDQFKKLNDAVAWYLGDRTENPRDIQSFVPVSLTLSDALWTDLEDKLIKDDAPESPIKITFAQALAIHRSWADLTEKSHNDQLTNIAELIQLLRDDRNDVAIDDTLRLGAQRTAAIFWKILLDRRHVSSATAETGKPPVDPAIEQTATKWFMDAEKSADPLDAFNMACYYEQISPIEMASAKLKIAAKAPEFKKAARTDPTLRLTQETHPELLYDELPESEWELELFAKVKPGATAAGIGRFAEFVQYPTTEEFAKQLGVSRYELARLQMAAGFVSRALANRSNSIEDKGIRLEVLDMVLARGINNEAQLSEVSAKELGEMAKNIAEELNLRFEAPPTRDTAKNWLQSLCSRTTDADAEFSKIAERLQSTD